MDLANVPLVSGLVHVRWHLRDSLRAEGRGKTLRAQIRDHKVVWMYEVSLETYLVIDKSNHLLEAMLEFQVFQEMYGGKERHALGKLALNLAEFATESEGLTRRYLLQESKVNSTLKLYVQMEQISGDRDYIAPEMKKAQVFGGIAGLLADGKQHKDHENELDLRLGSSRSGTHDRDGLEMEQDIYRNSLTRRWQAQAGEQDSVDVIEDIFKGGDGWLKPDEHRMTSTTGNENKRVSKLEDVKSTMGTVDEQAQNGQCPVLLLERENEEILMSVSWSKN